MRAFGRIVLREWRFLRGKPLLASLPIFGPLVFALIVGAVYSNRKITALPVAIVDQDNSALSREITCGILATEPFTFGRYLDSAADFKQLAIKGPAQVCFVFPEHFERDVKSGKGAGVAVLVDAANLITGNVAVTAANSVLASYSVGIDVKRMQMRGVAADRARRVALPIVLQTRTLFNPAFNGNYANFLVLGFVAVAVQLAPLLAVSRAGSRESGPDAAELYSITRNPALIAAAKCGAYTAVVWPAAWLSIRLTLWFFGLPMRGSEWLLGLLCLWFVSNLTSVGFGVSCLTKDELFGSEICALLTMPNFLLSGFTWPVFAMPRALQILAYVLPMNPLVFSLRRLAMMGAAPGDFGLEFELLTAWTIAGASLAIWGAWRLRRYEVGREVAA